MDTLMKERIFGIPWVILALLGALLALIYAFIPVEGAADGTRWLRLRWGHTVAWALLGLAAFIRAKVTSVPIEVAAPVAALGGLVYVALMLLTA